MPQKKIVVWLIIIFVCGALIRLPYFLTVIPEAGVWGPKIVRYDEALSIHFASQKILQTIALSGLDTTPCLFFIILHFWLLLFGSASVVVAAILPFLFSMASIIAIYFLGKRIYDKKIGLSAAALLALSPLNIQYATEIRTYSLLVFLTILFLLFLWRVKDNDKARDWVGAVVFSLLLLYAHYTAMILIAFGWIFLMAVKKNETKKIVFSFLAIGAGAAPLFLIFQRWTDFFGMDTTSFFGRFFSHGSLLAFFQYLYFISFGSFGADGAMVILSLLIIGLLICVWRRDNNLNSRALIVFIVAGWLALAAIKLIFHERYYLLFTVPMILIAAIFLRVAHPAPLAPPLAGQAGLAALAKYRLARVVAGLLMFFVFVFPGYTASNNRAYKYFAPDFVKIINSQYQAGDVIIADHHNELLWLQYYSGPAEIKLFFPYKNELLDPDSKLRWRYSDYTNITRENVELFDDLVKNQHRFWIIRFSYQAISIQDPQGLLKKYLNDNYSKQASYFFPVFTQNNGIQAELLLYAAKPAH